jgi:hypothetical protein
LKLLLARLQRMQFGRKSEKLAKQIEQLELRLEELQSKPGKTPVQRWNPPSLLIRTLPPPNQPAIRYQDIFRVKRGGMSRRSRHVQIGAGYCASWARMCVGDAGVRACELLCDSPRASQTELQPLRTNRASCG